MDLRAFVGLHMGPEQHCLLAAVKNDETDTVANLIKKGTCVTTITDNFSRSPLHFAASNGNNRMVTILLNAGVDPSGTDKYKFAPLHLAADSGDIATVRTLLEHGALNQANQFGHTPQQIATEKNHTTIVELIKSYAKK